jgi:spore coat protein CotH
MYRRTGMTRPSFLVLFGLGLSATLLATPAVAQTADELFDDGTLHEVKLLLNSADWAKLKAEFETNTYYPADLEWRGVKVRNVGIRSRGLGTRNGIKPGLRVDMNRYASGQRFLGLRSILLDNVYRDVSGIRDRIAMKLFTRMNVPAPRISHARLTINGEYAGLYAITEELGEDFVRRVFKKPESDEPDKGYLFEYKWIEDWNFRYLGGDLDVYRTRFEARTHENDSMTDLYGPIEALVRAVNEAPGDRFVEDVGAWLDLTRFMIYAAVEAFLVDYDGLVGYKGMANFYLYRPEDSTRAIFIPWDKDQTFFVANRDTGHGLGANELLRRAIDVPELHTVYLDTLEATARLAEERGEGASAGWLEAEIVRALDQIRSASLADPGRWFGVDDIQAERERLIEFARTRPGFVRCQVENSRRRDQPQQTCTAPSSEAPR